MTIPEDGKGKFCAAPLSLGDAACGLRRTPRFYKPPVDFGKTVHKNDKKGQDYRSLLSFGIPA